MRNLQKSLLLYGAVAALAITAVSGCSTWGEKGDGRSAGRVTDDKKIREQVEKKLDNETVYKFDHVDVKTFSGVVQLSGFVDTEEQKRRAEELAQDVEGVAQVVNSIALKPQVTPAGRPTGTYTNAPSSTTPPPPGTSNP